MAAEFSPAERWLVCDLTQYLLVPNVSPNWAETQERQKASLKELQPVYFKVKRGEMLIREGEPVTSLHLAKLEAQSKLYPRSRAVVVFLGILSQPDPAAGGLLPVGPSLPAELFPPPPGPGLPGGPAADRRPAE